MSNCFEPRHPRRDEGNMVFDTSEEYPTIPVSSWDNGKVYPRSQGKPNRFFRILLPLIPLVLLVIGSLAVANFYPLLTQLLTGVHTIDTSDATPTHTFSVGFHPDIIINDQGGAVSVQPGQSNQVVVNVDPCACGFAGWHWSHHMNGLPNYAQPAHVSVRYQQTGNEIIVTADGNSWQGNADGSASVPLPVKLTVFVPTISDVQVKTGAQDAHVAGINGQFAFNSVSGSLLASDLQGQVVAHSEYGDLGLRNVALNGRSSLSTGHGDIAVGGTLDPNGDYQFKADYGNVNLALAGSTSFLLQANVNSIENEFGGNQVGSGPYAHLNVQASNGNLFLKQDW